MRIFSENLDYALGWMVIHSLWQATIIALTFGVAIIFLRKQSAKLRYIVSNIALLTVLLCAIGTFSWYYFEANQPVKIDFAQNQINNSIKKAINPVITEFTPVTVSPTENSWSVANFRDYFEQNLPLIVTVWLMGVAVFLMRLLGGISYIYYLRTRMNFPPDEYWVEVLERLSQKAGIKRAIELVESAMVRTPMVVGYLKPLILFPIGMINRLSEKEVEAILAHEIAHVLRHDYLFNIFQSVVEALFYYHPAVWWISAQIRDEREMACDEIAIDLLGNSMNYAKALVLIQEMAFFPLTASLAFAGQSKNQFLMRMQRILNQPQNKSNIMEKLIATLLVLFTLIGLNAAQKNNSKFEYTNITEGANIISGEGPMKTSGFWNATIENDEVCVTFNNSEKKNMWVSNECFKKNEFSNLPTTDAEFTLTRAAGTITFKGKFDGNEGYGKQTFVPNTAFKKVIAEKGISETTDELMFFAFLSNVNEVFFDKIKAYGFNDISSEKLKELMIFRLDINTIASYINAFKSKGYAIESLEEIMSLKIHGVDVAYIQQMDNAMNKNLTLEEILNTKIHNLQPDQIATLENVTNEKMNSEDHLNFAIHGIDANYIQAIQSIFGKNLSNEDILNAKIYDINAPYVNSFKSIGVEDLNLENVLNLKIHDVSPGYYKSFESVGLKNMDVEDIVGLKIYNITPDFVKEMRQKGYSSTKAQRYIELKIQNYENFAEGPGLSFPVAPISPLAPLSTIDIRDNNRSFSYENGKLKRNQTGKFGHRSDNGVDTWFNGDYKIIEKEGEITKAFYKEKAMSKAEIEEMKETLEEMIKKLRENNEEINALALEKEALNAEKMALEFEKREQKNFQRENLTRQKEMAARQAEIEVRKQENTIRQKELAARQAEIDAHRRERQSYSTSEGVGRMNDDKESKALSWFLRQLLTDKYYEIGKKTEFGITKKGVSVNGKNLPNDVFERYKSNIERILGKPLSNKFKYYFKGKVNGYEGDSFNMDGEFTINPD